MRASQAKVRDPTSGFWRLLDLATLGVYASTTRNGFVDLPEPLLMVGKSMEAAGKFSEATEAYRGALNANAALPEARERLDLLEERSSRPPAVHKR